MSVHDRAAAAVLAQLALVADGALLGVGVAYVAYRTIRKFLSTSSALRKIRDAPSVHPSDLRLLLSDGEDSSFSGRDGGDASSSNFGGGKLVVVRGSVESKSGFDEVCVLCHNSNETLHHLFFECVWSKDVLMDLLSWLKVDRCPMQQWQRWVMFAFKKWKFRQMIIRSTMVGAMNKIWEERKLRSFNQVERTHVQVVANLKKDLLQKWNWHPRKKISAGEVVFWLFINALVSY